MKVRLVNENFESNYGEQYLKSKGIKNIEEYINPLPTALENPLLLDNIKEGVELLLSVLGKKEPKILLIVDSDNDGFTSSAIMYQYIKFLRKDTNIEYRLHEGKQHGLEDHIDYILENKDKYDLVILPDSSSNDFEYHELLKPLPCLVLDHHILESEVSSNAIIINNQSSEKYLNKDLCGAGVVYQFCRYIDSIKNTTYADTMTDLAAWGIIGDMMSLLSLENRYIIKKGLSNVNNFFFKTLIEKQSFSMKGEVTPMTVAFYIVPLVNAMIRVGTMEEKNRLFEAFVNGEEMCVSHKRGANGALEKIAIESARECTNAKNKQNRLKEKAVDELEIKIHKNDLLENKVLLVRLDEDDDFPAELNGLVAMQLVSKFKKPTILARLNNEGYDRGSARGLNQSELSSFKEFLDSTKMFEYTAGHDNAFGVSISDKKLDDFHKYANEALANYDFGENFYDVNFIRMANDEDISNIIFDLYDYRGLCGQGIEEPRINIKCINLHASDINIIGRNSDTVKFTKNGIEYIKFFAKDMIKELAEYDGEIQIEVVGKGGINEWGGNMTPQIMIEDYEIKDGTLIF